MRGKNLNAYALAGVRSDHESTEIEEAREKLRLGMHLLVREGSTERNLEHIIALVTPQNSANCSFATDDKLPGDLVREGHIDHSIRKAISSGVSPITAIQMGTINTARHYRLKNHGAIAPRYWADFIVIDDLENMSIRRVYKKGKLVAENGRYIGEKMPEVPQPRSTMNLSYRAPQDFETSANGAKQDQSHRNRSASNCDQARFRNTESSGRKIGRGYVTRHPKTGRRRAASRHRQRRGRICSRLWAPARSARIDRRA